MLFLGCLFDREQENDILKLSTTKLSNAANTFQWNLIDGLVQNLGNNLKIVNVLPVGTFPKNYKKIILNSKKWNYKKLDNFEVGCVNIPFLKQIIRSIKIKKIVNKSNEKEILIYSLYAPFLYAVYKLKKDYKITLIVTDLPEFSDYGYKNVSLFKKCLRKINNRHIEKYLKRIDRFVLLTEQMKEVLDVGKRPYVVVEGIGKEVCGDKDACEKSDKKIVLYTGGVHEKYGIISLLDAFSMISDQSYELWIAGAGDAVEEVKQRSLFDSRIKYWGYVTKREVQELQNKATILINTRKNEGDYVKYSFPSKTMEYMMSEKPVVMYKLDGVPDEYDEYLYYIKDNTVESLKDAIVEVCELDVLSRKEQAMRAKLFIKNNKNPYVQANKIVDMIEKS